MHSESVLQNLVQEIQNQYYKTWYKRFRISITKLGIGDSELCWKIGKNQQNSVNLDNKILRKKE